MDRVCDSYPGWKATATEAWYALCSGHLATEKQSDWHAKQALQHLEERYVSLNIFILMS